MKVCIPSYNRHATISTHRVFAGCDYTVLVHTAEQRDKYWTYAKDTGLDPSRIVVTHTECGPTVASGLTRQREWACEHRAEGEWIVFADDNIKALTALERPWYDDQALEEFGELAETTRTWRPRFKQAITGERFVTDHALDTIALCEQVGAHLAGFAVMDNPLFRLKKWRTAGYAIGKLMCWRVQHDFPWDHSISMEDFYHTAVGLLRDGAVVVNNYVWPQAGHYEAGGMGPYDTRVPWRQHDVQELLQRFPGLFRVKDRKGFVPNTELALRLHSPKQIATWRGAMAARKEQTV